MRQWVGVVLTLAAATLARFILSPLLHGEFPLHPYAIGVGVIGYYWGLGPACTSIGLGLLAGRYFFIEPIHSWTIPGQSFLVRAIGFTAYSLLFVAVTTSFRKARSRADTARQQAEAAEFRTRSILDSISDGFAQFDSSLRFESVNPRLAELCRRPESDLIGRRVWDALPDLETGSFAKALNTVGTSRKPAHFEDHYDPYGIWFEGMVYPVPGGFTAFVRDITARKQSEMELRRKSEQLQRSNTELEQFAYAAAHDLQEPLRSISFSAQMLLDRVGPKLADSEQEVLRIMVTAASRMRALIQDLLSYSRAVSRQVELLVPVDLNVVAEMAIMNCRPALDEAVAEIETGSLPLVLGNENLLTQVLQNLISNAAKYRRPDVRPHVKITASQAGHEWIIEVADNGIGIAPEHTERIFGVFKRLHGQEIPGTGIGLAICKRIVENLGGRIWVESKVGEGSVFRFTVADGHQF